MAHTVQFNRKRKFEEINEGVDPFGCDLTEDTDQYLIIMLQDILNEIKSQNI